MLIPTLDLICDPDYINTQLITYLTSKENLNKSLNRKFSYAASYEDFIKIIKSSNNPDEIKQYHYKIMNEIMQATLISDFQNSQANENLNNSNGMSTFYAGETKTDADIDASNLSKSNSVPDLYLHTKNTKAEMLRSRNLKAYLKQLRYSKMLCERRLKSLSASTMMV